MKRNLFILIASPREDGNGSKIASFIFDITGSTRHIIIERLSDYKISPCLACGFCAKQPGFCRYDADFDDKCRELLSLLINRENDVLLISPIWFYGIPGQLKSLLDRSQCIWELEKFESRHIVSKENNFACIFTSGRVRGDKIFDSAILESRTFASNFGFDYHNPLLLRGMDDLKFSATHDVANQIREWTLDITL